MSSACLLWYVFCMWELLPFCTQRVVGFEGYVSTPFAVWIKVNRTESYACVYNYFMWNLPCLKLSCVKLSEWWRERIMVSCNSAALSTVPDFHSQVSTPFPGPGFNSQISIPFPGPGFHSPFPMQFISPFPGFYSQIFIPRSWFPGLHSQSSIPNTNQISIPRIPFPSSSFPGLHSQNSIPIPIRYPFHSSTDPGSVPISDQLPVCLSSHLQKFSSFPRQETVIQVWAYVL